MTAVIVIPWRDKGAGDLAADARRRNLRYVLAHLERIAVAPVIVISDGLATDAPFNRSMAYNRGVAAAGQVDAYCFHEADMLVSAAQLRAGIQQATDAPGLVIPFDTYHYLSPRSTRAVLSGDVNPWRCVPERRMVEGRSVGPVNIVSSHTMAEVGRWDEVFAGWGWDDRAMAEAFSTATKTATRFITGPGVHLWHPPGWAADGKLAGGTDAAKLSPAEKIATEANRYRYRLYVAAKTPAKIRHLTSGGGST